ncbi:Exopolyphosphatase [Methylophaga frappieri]|uniref:Exopolyphosphatase n=1 Tax=Methylophaga frappieri (strain ATCC BAA-2434 / DSM 25690 / JAM7) TaxID=754477 RepID=I1YJ58_METFJ|nr:exopolyphosphatase [Methylophaga frappieri]AFJ02951.1 Exopolyphosphatase [Methylophaga frappieri]
MQSDLETEEVLAAVDLGSNSFHMIIARLRDGQFQIMDRLREMVQLRAGLDKHNMLSDAAQKRAVACLERFGQRIRELPHSKVRIVGTNTLRNAENSRDFLRLARQALGHPIEIVTGEEEARLIYLGVARSLAFDNQRRLVMDIGGGSTEFIIGEGVSGQMRESLEMGCVSFTQQFFSDGHISAIQMHSAILAAAIRLRSIQRPYQRMGWVEAVGASGTIRCVADIVTAQGWTENGVITTTSLEKLIEALLTAGHQEKIDLQGLSDERKSVLPAGVAILKAAFDRLKIDRMVVSDGALREGLLYDLQGRIQHDDERDRTVQALIRRYQVDEAHARRVSEMAGQLFQQVAADWQLNQDEHLCKLQWAAQLHEVGLAISHYQYHKHAAYLVAHSDMPGFSREEQYALSAMMRGQRRSIPSKQINQLSEELQLPTLRLMVLLRLSLVFNRGRSEQTDTYVKLMVTEKGLKLTLPPDWLSDHPLTEADLKQEKHYLKSADIRLKIDT